MNHPILLSSMDLIRYLTAVFGGLMQTTLGRAGTARLRCVLLLVVITLTSSFGGSPALAQGETDPSGLCGSWPVPNDPDGVPPELSLQWPTPDVVMRTGIEANIWGYVSDDQAVASIQAALQHIASGLWWRTDQTWGARTMHPAAVVDTAGHWRWSQTPQAPGSFRLIIEARDDAGNLTTQETSFSVIGETLVPLGPVPTPLPNATPGPTVVPTPEPERSPLPTDGPTPVPTPDAPLTGDPEWVLRWSDEFSQAVGSPPDATRWSTEIGGWGWGNQEHQFYTDSTRNAAQDGNGHLVITAREESVPSSSCWYGSCRYSSARLTTEGSFDQKYGRFEARLKLPYGQGIWPAFWTLGNDFREVGWPATGEIDIMENIGREPATVYGTIHGPGYSGGAGLTGSFELPAGEAFADAFHVFRIDWAPGEIRWFVDDTLIHALTPGDLPVPDDWVFDHPFFLILNIAVGGQWPGYPDDTTTFPQTMLVDYVRAYERVLPEIHPEPFTYVVLPDTQYMTSQTNQAVPEQFDRQTEWIASRASQDNIKFVSHLGDIVDFGGNRAHWEIADRALSKLDGVVPYGLTFGNHDADDRVWGRRDTIFNEYFPRWRYEEQAWYGGSYPSNKNTNSFQIFTAGEMEYLVLHLQWDPPAEVRAWADTVLTAHPTKRVLVSTHEFPGNWLLWNEVLQNHSNVFMVVSGHECARERFLPLENAAGGVVYTVLTDYQCDNPSKAFLRTYSFLADGDIEARTYSPWTEEFETDSSSAFRFRPDYAGATPCPPPTPFGASRFVLPGRMEAENYDAGCAGETYVDRDSLNEGGAYRDDGVDLEATIDGGVNLGWTRDGEWLTYSIHVPQSGSYDLRLRVASEGNGSSIRLSLDGTTLVDAIAIPSTGGWQRWEEVSHEGLQLESGEHLLRVDIDDGDFNLDWIDWAPAP
jgi:beta-glucanase (GH16 family)